MADKIEDTAVFFDVVNQDLVSVCGKEVAYSTGYKVEILMNQGWCRS